MSRQLKGGNAQFTTLHFVHLNKETEDCCFCGIQRRSWQQQDTFVLSSNLDLDLWGTVFGLAGSTDPAIALRPLSAWAAQQGWLFPRILRKGPGTIDRDWDRQFQLWKSHSPHIQFHSSATRVCPSTLGNKPPILPAQGNFPYAEHPWRFRLENEAELKKQSPTSNTSGLSSNSFNCTWIFKILSVVILWTWT